MHTSEITSDGAGEDKEYAVGCSCRTHYVSRLRTYADAVAVRTAHKQAVADGTWQAEQDAEAARLAERAPLNAAKREHFEALDDRRSAGFGVLIAKQRGGDVEAARADLAAADARLAAAVVALAAFEVSA